MSQHSRYRLAVQKMEPVLVPQRVSRMGFEQVGKMEEVAFHPILTYDTVTKCIHIQQDLKKYRKRRNHYYKYNVETNECQKVILQIKFKDKENKSDAKIVKHAKFESHYRMYLYDEDKWYIIPIPSLGNSKYIPDYSSFTNYSYIEVMNKLGTLQYVILFGGMDEDENMTDLILIFDCINHKWYSSNIELPQLESHSSSILIDNSPPTISILSNWYKIYKINNIKAINDLIIEYTQTLKVYIFGGINGFQQGIDQIYSCDLQQILLNKQTMEYADEQIKDIEEIDEDTFNEISSTEITVNNLNDLVCFEFGADCMVLPCKHIVLEKMCFDDLMANKENFNCGVAVTDGYQVM